MSVTQRHLRSLVPHELHHRFRIGVIHTEVTAETMPEVMKHKVCDAGLLEHRFERRPPILVGLPAAVTEKDEIIRTRAPSLYTVRSSVSRSGVIGTVRFSSFLLYAHGTVRDLLRKSILPQVVRFNSLVRNPVCQAARTRSRKFGLQLASTRASSSSVRYLVRPFSSLNCGTSSVGFTLARFHVIAVANRFPRRDSSRLMVAGSLPAPCAEVCISRRQTARSRPSACR
jgi:hypothetical protein